MIDYKFIKEDVLNSGRPDYRILVSDPYDYLSLIFQGNETPEHIQVIINEIKKVKEGKEEDFYFGNDTGFSAVAAQENLENEEEPDEGIYIYDGYSKEPGKALFIIPIDEIIQLLEDFKNFIEESKG